jgi:hypothetical protein
VIGGEDAHEPPALPRRHRVAARPRRRVPAEHQPRHRPLAIGLSLGLIHLISIPVTNTSVNPARSTGPAVFVGGWAIRQLWMFWLAPLVGAAIIYPVVQPEEPPTTTEARPVLADRV